MRRTAAVLTSVTVLVTLPLLIFLSGCDRDAEHGDGGAVTVPVAVGALSAADEQVDKAATSGGSRQSTGHVPHLVDATSGQYTHTNRLIDETSRTCSNTLTTRSTRTRGGRPRSKPHGNRTSRFS